MALRIPLHELRWFPKCCCKTMWVDLGCSAQPDYKESLQLWPSYSSIVYFVRLGWLHSIICNSSQSHLMPFVCRHYNLAVGKHCIHLTLLSLLLLHAILAMVTIFDDGGKLAENKHVSLYIDCSLYTAANGFIVSHQRLFLRSFLSVTTYDESSTQTAQWYRHLVASAAFP